MTDIRGPISYIQIEIRNRKNPFAAVCRGISAKRSIPQEANSDNNINNNIGLSLSQQELWQWQPDPVRFRSKQLQNNQKQQQAISHRSQQPQNTLLYQLLLPIPTMNINYKSSKVLQQQLQQDQLNNYNNPNNINSFEISTE